MTLPELAIRRHVLAWVISGVIALFGLIAYQRIGVDRFPNVDLPMISVTTVLAGADPETVATTITQPIEEKVNAVAGIERVLSFSSPGVSVVTIQFELKKDIDVAFNEVQVKVQQALAELPKEIEPPVVAKLEVGATPVVWFALTGARPLDELNRIARDVIKPRLENISGVGGVEIGGERKPKVRIWLDLARMQALGVGINEVIAAIKRMHLKFPGGFLVSGGREYMIKLDFEAKSPQELAAIPLRAADGREVRLGDVARVEMGLEDARALARFDGKPAVGIGLVKVAGANAVRIVEEAKRRMDEEIRPLLPPDVKVEVASDDARVILGIIAGLKEHLVESVVLAGLVVWFFLRQLGATLAVAATIPVSLLGAVAIAYFAGFTVNMILML
ncbi:MAG: efflux RND transporter permease subunit, partial [Zetaproteobacteria bacterium]